MKKSSALLICFTLLLFTVAFFSLNSCSKDDDQPAPVVNYEAEIVDYTIKVKEPNTIYPIRNYKNLNTNEEFIVFGNYDDNFVLDKITQIVYQNTESHLELSFDRNGVLTTITNYDLSSNTINDQIFIKKEGSKFYLSRNNETIERQKGDDVKFELLFDDLIERKLNSTLNNNAELFSYLNGSDGLAKHEVGEQKAQFVTLPVAVAAISVVLAVKYREAIEKFVLNLVTNRTEIQGDNYSDIVDKAGDCASQKAFLKSSSTNNSNYMCNSNIAHQRERNHNLNLSLCGTSICVKDCAGTVNGTAYYDKCNVCVGGETGKTECVKDCNGDVNGTAYYDKCNICVGGNTGNTECEKDCNGDIDGTAYLDDCNICVGGNTGKTECVKDCNGDVNGTAYMDECNVCVGGNTGKDACVASYWRGTMEMTSKVGGDSTCQSCTRVLFGSASRSTAELIFCYSEVQSVNNFQMIFLVGGNISNYAYTCYTADIKQDQNFNVGINFYSSKDDPTTDLRDISFVITSQTRDTMQGTWSGNNIKILDGDCTQTCSGTWSVVSSYTNPFETCNIIPSN